MSVATTPLPAQPEAPASRPRTWLRKIYSGGQIIETCPAWCTFTHEHDDSGMLDDLAHSSSETSMSLPGVSPLARPLSARVQVAPYDTNPALNVPHIVFEPCPDEILEALTPEEFAGVIAEIRAHADRLEVVLAQLVLARAEHAGATATA